jgi:predicted permease
MQSILQDLRYALRQLRKAPGFSLIAIMTLALGIGANTVIFTVAKLALLDTLAVPDANQLRLLTIVVPKKSVAHHFWGDFRPDAQKQMTTSSFSYPVYEYLKAHDQSLTGIFAFKDLAGYNRLNVAVDGNAEMASAQLVSGNYFDTLQVRPAYGRTIEPADDATPGAGTVAVISDEYWASRFGRSTSVLGKVVQVNFKPVTIVGIMPQGFTGAAHVQQGPQVFIPMSMQPAILPRDEGSLLTNTDLWWMQIMGRLKPGVSDEQAQAALAVELDQAVRATMTVGPDQTMPRMRLAAGNRGMNSTAAQMAQPVHVLMALVGMVLLLACANIANLLLARSSARQREISVRLALGATRARILRQMFTESLLLSLLGGAAGLVLGYFGRKAIPRLLTNSWETAPYASHFDWQVFGFTAGISVVSAMLFGFVPAWLSSQRANLNTGLKDGSAGATKRRKGLAGKSLAVFQVALSLLLLVGAGLFLRSFMNVRNTPLGFSPENITLFSIQPPKSHYPANAQLQLFQRIEESLTAIPGVDSITLTGEPLLSNDMDSDAFIPEGTAAQKGSAQNSPDLSAYYNTVGNSFFTTYNIPVVAGRGFDSRDTGSSVKVAVINRTLAKKFFPNSDPIGKTFQDSDKDIIRIVGISGDAKYADLRSEVPPTAYLDYAQWPTIDIGMTFAIRSRADQGSIVTAARRAVQSVDRNLPLIDIRSQTEQIDATMMQDRIFAALTAGFGMLALLLACIGIYGVLAYRVAQRTSEIGIRLALGAQTRQVLWMILRETSWMAVAGVSAGLGGALLITRLLKSMLFEVTPSDPVTLVGSSLLLIAVALAAGGVPAFRASRVDPIVALRTE